MNERPQRVRWHVQHKLILSHAAVAILTLLAAGMLTGIITPFIPDGFGRLLVAAGIFTMAALFSILFSVGVTHRLGRRLAHSFNIIQVWLRGNLTARIADPTSDDLGVLTQLLDQLAEHVQESEQDIAELRERNACLSDQVRALAVVDERNRLARELHDGVKQHLFSLSLTASALRERGAALPADVQELLTEIEASAQVAQRETTRLIEDLRPDSLQVLGLAKALHDYTLLFGAQEHLLVYFNVDGDDSELPPSIVEAFYRVAQEALHNVARHARATRVDVNLRCTPDRAVLTVGDNGIGFEQEALRQGLGLPNMQERMLTVGGKLTIETQMGNGTMISAQVERRRDAGPALPHPGQCPIPRPENWAWLGQRLVIPVGQTWPWPPAEQAYLRHPLIFPNAEPLRISSSSGFLGLRRGYTITENDRPLIHFHTGLFGYDWKLDGEVWGLRHVRGLGGRLVLIRKGQALAAMQYRGRQVHKWSEIIYDDHGYRLAYADGDVRTFVLTDESGATILQLTGAQITRYRELPLSLLVMVVARVLDELSVTSSEADGA